MAAAGRALRAGGAALLACGAAAASAQADLRWGLSAGVTDRHLVEYAASGARLLTESGPVARLRLDAQLGLPGGGALRGELEGAGGSLHYDGQTQAGTPLTTRTDHSEVALALAWRPLPAADWGEAWLTLRGLRQQREIRSTVAATGLDETSKLLLAGLRWARAFDASGWRWEPSLEWRASVNHSLAIGYQGLFDPSDLEGGRRRETVLGLAVTPGGSPWRVDVEWQHARQSASPRQTLYRGGVPVGTVLQPRLAIDDWTLRVRREF